MNIHIMISYIYTSVYIYIRGNYNDFTATLLESNMWLKQCHKPPIFLGMVSLYHLYSSHHEIGNPSVDRDVFLFFTITGGMITSRYSYILM